MKRTSLPYRARLWLPTVKVNDALRDDIEAKAPGYTESCTFGSDGSTREPVSVFEILYGDDDFETEPMLLSVVEDLLDSGEKCVLLELNGKAALYTK